MKILRPFTCLKRKIDRQMTSNNDTVISSLVEYHIAEHLLGSLVETVKSNNEECDWADVNLDEHMLDYWNRTARTVKLYITILTISSKDFSEDETDFFILRKIAALKQLAQRRLASLYTVCICDSSITEEQFNECVEKIESGISRRKIVEGIYDDRATRGFRAYMSMPEHIS